MKCYAATLVNLRVGEFITIKNHPEMVKKYLDKSFSGGFDINHLIYICRLTTKKKYKVVDVCKTCKMCKIKVGKMWVPIKYEFIDDHSTS